MPVRRNLITVALLLVLCSACAPHTAPGAAATNAAVAAAADPATESAAQGYSVRVTFIDSVLYAGATHFFFERADGKRFRVIQSNDAGEIRIENANMLLDPNPDEGPPGPNPAFIGRTVTLHYDSRDRVVAIMPAYE